MQSRIDIEGLREARDRLDATGDRARRPEPALRSPATRRALQQSERDTFAGNRFTKNSPAWDARKRRRGLSPKRMQATGLLRMILEAGSFGTANSVVVFRAFNSTLTWGLRGGRSVVYYARIWANRDKKRRTVKINRRARVAISEIVGRYVWDAEGVT